jgi:glycosyltransferase involved in cell wall biosynthesis
MEFHHTVDTVDWSRRHSRGEVPDAWPYGLDRLAHHGVEAVVRPPISGGAGQFVARVGRGIGGFQWVETLAYRPLPDIDVAVAWDERSGVPRALLDGRRVPVATGAIWATEADVPRRLQRLAARGFARSRLVWALSTAQLDILAGWGLDPSTLAHLPFGVDTDFFRPGVGVARDADLLLTVGNDRHRDFGTVLAAFEQLRRRRPSLRLVAVTRQELPATAGVEVVPHLSHGELRHLYQQAAVVLVGLRHNLHVSGITVVLEAMSLDRPVVATRTPGMEHYVAPGSGWLVEPGDPGGMARAAWEALGAADLVTRPRVVDGFSTETQAATLAELLGDTVQAGRLRNG